MTCSVDCECTGLCVVTEDLSSEEDDMREQLTSRNNEIARYVCVCMHMIYIVCLYACCVCVLCTYTCNCIA